jgi:cytidylate kinase
MVITISRQFGAGGSEVAKLVAADLGWSVVDNEIVDQVAERAGLSHDEAAERDERTPSFVERLARTLAISSQEFVLPEAGITPELEEPRLVRMTEAVVKEAAAHGRVVLVGRAAAVVLAPQRDALHVRLVAPKEFRVRVIMERNQLDARQAEKLLETTDAQRARYHKEYYARDWHDPVNYHIVLNTGMLTCRGAADVIVARVRAMGWEKQSARC